MGYLSKMTEGGFEEVTLLHHRDSGLRAVIALHSTVRGPALGGTRLWQYSCEEEAVADAMRLARGMTYKAAAAELPLGGGKAVILGPVEPRRREAIFRAYGQGVNRLQGRYITAVDMGTTAEDMDIIRHETAHVMGGREQGSPSPHTAYGVWRGMQACAAYLYGSPSLEGRTVALQGLGEVGGALAALLAAEGARLVVTDLDRGRVEEARCRWSAAMCAPEEIFDQPCDIFAPCAGGGVINPGTAARLRCRIVAGAANNVLAGPEGGEALHRRGILYAPDYVINAGGLTFVETCRWGGADPGELRARLDRIASRLEEIFKLAAARCLRPEEAADRYAEERLRDTAPEKEGA